MMRLRQRGREKEEQKKKVRKHERVREKGGREGIRGISQMEIERVCTDKWCLMAETYLRSSLISEGFKRSKS